jgi:hypothetical protein
MDTSQVWKDLTHTEMTADPSEHLPQFPWPILSLGDYEPSDVLAEAGTGL